MPKNQFQRPAPIQHTRNVPRHGAPLPTRKAEGKQANAPAKSAAPPALPPLEALLKLGH